MVTKKTRSAQFNHFQSFWGCFVLAAFLISIFVEERNLPQVPGRQRWSDSQYLCLCIFVCCHIKLAMLDRIARLLLTAPIFHSFAVQWQMVKVDFRKSTSTIEIIPNMKKNPKMETVSKKWNEDNPKNENNLKMKKTSKKKITLEMKMLILLMGKV